VFAFLCFGPVSAQEIPTVSSSTVAEEQDYAFAVGLYRDSLFQLAGQQFEAFVGKYPNSIKRQDAAFLSVECLFQSSQFQNAASKYNEFILNYPASRYVPEAYLKLGQSRLNQKKNTEAVIAFKTVIEKFAENEVAGEAAYWVGEAYLRNDDMQNAVKYYTLAYDNFPRNRLRDYALYSIAWALQKQSKYEKASEWYVKLIAEFPKSSLTSGAHVRIGECFYYAKDYRRAIDALIKSRAEINDEEELGNSDYLIAEAYYKLNDLSEAQARYERFLAEHPNHTFAGEVTYDLAWIYYDRKDYPKAIQTFDKLTAKEDELGHAALYRRGTAERFAGQKEAALKTFAEVVQREPQGRWSDNALFDAGMIYFEETNVSRAKTYFQQLIREFPSSDVMADGCRMLGECLLAEGSFKEAQVWFEKALTVTAASFDVKVEAGFQSALCAYKLKQYKEASAKFAAFAVQYSKHPKTGEAKFYQAESEYKLGNYNISVGLYSGAAENVNAAKKEEALYGIA
jgi:TolA-binding protein